MTVYHVQFTDAALREMKKLDRHTALLILAWIRKNLEGCTDPRQHGKDLTANHSGQWRYRIGDYRILAEIIDATVTILILNAGHCRDIYGN